MPLSLSFSFTQIWQPPVSQKSSLTPWPTRPWPRTASDPPRTSTRAAAASRGTEKQSHRQAVSRPGGMPRKAWALPLLWLAPLRIPAFTMPASTASKLFVSEKKNVLQQSSLDLRNFFAQQAVLPHTNNRISKLEPLFPQFPIEDR